MTFGRLRPLVAYWVILPHSVSMWLKFKPLWKLNPRLLDHKYSTATTRAGSIHNMMSTDYRYKNKRAIKSKKPKLKFQRHIHSFKARLQRGFLKA